MQYAPMKNMSLNELIETALKKFKSFNLTIEDFTMDDLKKMEGLLDIELAIHTAKFEDFPLKRVIPLKKDYQFKHRKLVSAEFKVEGSYFSKREAITFDEDG